MWTRNGFRLLVAALILGVTVPIASAAPPAPDNFEIQSFTAVNHDTFCRISVTTTWDPENAGKPFLVRYTGRDVRETPVMEVDQEVKLSDAGSAIEFDAPTITSVVDVEILDSKGSTLFGSDRIGTPECGST